MWYDNINFWTICKQWCNKTKHWQVCYHKKTCYICFHHLQILPCEKNRKKEKEKSAFIAREIGKCYRWCIKEVQRWTPVQTSRRSKSTPPASVVNRRIQRHPSNLAVMCLWADLHYDEFGIWSLMVWIRLAVQECEQKVHTSKNTFTQNKKVSS
jgi:hypothetical protein